LEIGNGGNGGGKQKKMYINLKYNFVYSRKRHSLFLTKLVIRELADSQSY